MKNNNIKNKGTKKEKYWLSLEQWSNDKSFQKMAGDKEFLNPLPAEKEGGLWERREFLQLMAAGMALASFGCVRRPAEKIVPYVRRPDDITLGSANFYSSSYYDGAEGFGILVKTREGRPIKIEGNPQHPVNRGKLSARAHSHILSLYDPERLKAPQQNLFNKERSQREKVSVEYATADQKIAEAIKEGSAVFLTGEWPSPASAHLLSSFCKAFNCSHYVWNPLNQAGLAEAQRLCYGEALVPRFALDRARLILSIESDFLGAGFNATANSRLYSQGRRANRDMNRLLVFESLLSLTGSNADERFRIKPSQALPLVLSLIHALIKKGFVGDVLPSFLKPPSQKPWEMFSLSEEKWDSIVQELWSHRGQSLVLAGAGTQAEGLSAKGLQVAVAYLNHILKNDGWTVDYKRAYHTWTSVNRDIPSLLQKLEKGQVKTLIIYKSNPLYTYPDRDRLEKAIKKANLVVYVGDREDETGRLAHYILPHHHDLEKWSDWEFEKGVLSIQQPTIRPLYNTRAFEDTLIQWAKVGEKPTLAKGVDTWYEYMKNRMLAQTAGGGFVWNHFLRDGVFIKKPGLREQRSPARAFKPSAFATLQEGLLQEGLSKNGLGQSGGSKGDYELVLYKTIGLRDGSMANVSWLQEFPDPVTKICWDNYVCVPVSLAQKFSLKEGQVLRLKTGSGQEVKAPLHIQPGQADGVLALALGYGRERAGKVANKVGVNAYPLAQVGTDGLPVFSALPVEFEQTSEQVPLANTQGHHSMEGRQIVVETTLKKYLKNPGGAIHRHKMISLWSSHEYPKHKWGMVIDLNSCTGCSACVLACQSENNIPTVGKDEVLKGREMHWIRVDRYYKGDPSTPKAVHQPVVCMHCDNAPCETVCPVLATVHSKEGTNDMIYNRCVGTRYCANNCPYKVRRFNWFNNFKNMEKPLEMALNPEVTVRSRGVMEKCTFCVQRIRAGQAEAKLKGRALKDGDIQTACQQSCPTGAIVFGDLKDKTSKVSRLFNREDSYALLEELNAKPSVRYQVKVRNHKDEDSHPAHPGKGSHHG